jgi:hypothetical protein
MSQSTSTSDRNGYRRDNYFGDEEAPHEPPAHSDQGPWDKQSIVAKGILLEVAPKLCGRSIAEAAVDDGHERELLTDADERYELTEPELHIPKTASDTWGTRDYGQYRHRRRYNEETGRISSGESTWVELGLVKHRELMECVEVAIRLYDPLQKEADLARERANELKRNPNGPVDVDIMAHVIGLLNGQNRDGRRE